MGHLSGAGHWLAVACQPEIMLRSAKVALVVGTLLAAINHGDAILAGELGMERALKIGLTYLVPYAVASWSAVQTVLASESSDSD